LITFAAENSFWNNMIFAAIDIGSNAVRLLFANAFDKNERIHIEKATLIRIPIRLGKDVYKNNTISKKRGDNLIKTLKAFKLLIDVYKPVDFIACATAAMREATNGPELLKQIFNETGIRVRTVDGLEEAEIVRSITGFDPPPGKTHTMYVDLGGGSTEISILNNNEVVGARSFKIGTIRILNKKVRDEQWDEMKTWLNQFKDDFGKINIIGSGGNINKIAKLYGDTSTNTLSYGRLKHAYEHLKSYSLHERIEELGLRPDRADVIIPAAKVFLFIAETIQSNSILAPKIGLADGLVYQLYVAYKSKNP
jgi:exopolyphosphatase/guanosine-5'-triphosphate,3'-diphosphate pyrophosphatase